MAYCELPASKQLWSMHRSNWVVCIVCLLKKHNGAHLGDGNQAASNLK